MSDHKFKSTLEAGSWCEKCGKDSAMLQLDPDLDRSCVDQKLASAIVRNNKTTAELLGQLAGDDAYIQALQAKLKDLIEAAEDTEAEWEDFQRANPSGNGIFRMRNQVRELRAALSRAKGE